MINNKTHPLFASVHIVAPGHCSPAACFSATRMQHPKCLGRTPDESLVLLLVPVLVLVLVLESTRKTMLS